MSTKPVDPHRLTDGELAWIMEHADVIEAWLKAVRALVLDKMMRGMRIKGQKLVLGRRTRNWRDEEKVVAFCRAIKWLREDDWSPRSLLSPSGLEKVIKARKRPDALRRMQRLVRWNDPAIHVAPTSDSRKTYRPGAEFNKTRS